jgi:hypothetical protein
MGYLHIPGKFFNGLAYDVFGLAFLNVKQFHFVNADALRRHAHHRIGAGNRRCNSRFNDIYQAYRRIKIPGNIKAVFRRVFGLLAIVYSYQDMFLN